MSAILLSNWWAFPALRPAAPDGSVLVSVLVPARNEAPVIAQTVQRLLRQTHTNFELLLLDDHSSDGTAAVAQAAAAGDARLRLLAGQALPPGWLGKNWACEQLARQARGRLLVFTDADVAWQPQALAGLVALAQHSRADLLSIWPTQRTRSWAERLTVPLMALVVHTYLPILGVHHTPFSFFAAANGQCLVFRRAAYDKIGGHRAVRASVLEDVSLARQVKRAGLRLRLAEGNRLITCRMYTDWPTVRDGYAKNILAGYGNPAGLLASTAFHWLVFLGPWLLLGIAWAKVGGGVYFLWALGLIALGILLRGLTAWRTGQRVADALLLPISVLLMTRIAAQALWWRWRFGGPLWKGRLASVQ